MQRSRQRKWIGLFLGVVLAGAALLGLAARAGATSPAVQPPAIADRRHHLSGVLVYPPARMRADHAGLAGSGASGGPGNVPARWAAPLTLPIFGPNVSASLGNASAQNETTDAINPVDDQRVIASANDYRCGLCPYVYLSTNGGTTWTNYAIAAPALNYGDPAMTFGTGGNSYFGYLGYTAVCSPGGGMYVSHSADAGVSFSAPHLLASNSNDGTVAVLQDKEYVAVDNMAGSPFSGNVYEGWTRFAFQAGAGCGGASSQLDASTIFSRSTDHGLSWSVPITASPVISSNNQGTVPAVGRHGEVYLYYLGAQTQSQLNYDTVLFSRSTDGGQTFPFFTHIASIVDLPSPLPHTSFRDNAFGAMAVDQQIDGYLYAVWADYRTGDADILFSRSTDNGTTWGLPQRVNDDAVGNGKDQFFPWITTSPDGRIHIGWFDRREDPNDANYKEYYTDSLDHGVSFEPNVAVSTAPSVPGSSPFIGDYSGIAASNGVVIPVWTDIRAGGNQDAYVARGIYTSTVTPSPVASNTATATAVPPTPTATVVPPTATSVLPTATVIPPTATVVPPTATPVPPTATSTTRPATGTPVPPSATATATVTPGCIFIDVCPGDYFYEGVRYLLSRYVISGYGDGTFRPYNPTTRSQLVKIVVVGYNKPITTPPAGGYTFADVQPGFPFFRYIETAAADVVVSGYACGGPGEPCDANRRPYFRPYANVTRGQLSKIDVVAAGWALQNPPAGTFADVAPGSAFYPFVETAACHGVISGYACGGPGEPCDAQHRPYFRPSANAARGQIAKIVYLSITGSGTCAAP